jgi:B-cell CLL/lymphoma protein 10|uniref:B-cell lymphoma/leukemia 10-like n=1 Tax=Oncorhynchus gorbuscha TaxID=8017 RepID=UPI001EAF3D17|nr:B-cell lymphoma/leukemia 10-like [Oncorhynchus gorbuscha]
MDSWCITDEDMAEVKKEALERLRPYLCEKLVADRHLDYLRSRRVLTRDDAEDICCRVGNSKKTGRMLDYLAENPRGLDYLVESICRVRTKDFVIGKITSEVEVVKMERREAAILSAAGSSSPVCICKERTPFVLLQSGSSEAQSIQTSLSNSEDKWGQNEASFSWSALPEGVSVSSLHSLPKPGEQGAPSVPLEDSEPGTLV